MTSLMEFAGDTNPKPPLEDLFAREAPGGGTVLAQIAQARENGVSWSVVAEWIRETYGYEYSVQHIGQWARKALK